MAIYNDDCINALKYIDENSIDLIFCSPPYANLRKYGGENSEASPDKYIDWFLPKADIFYKLLKPTGSMIININDCVVNRFRSLYVFKLVIALCENYGFQLFERLFWDKSCSPPTTHQRFRDTTEYIFWFVKSKDFKFKIDRGRLPYNPITINRYKSQVPTWHTRDPESRICEKCEGSMTAIKDRLKCKNCGNEVQNAIKMKMLDLNPLGAHPSTLLHLGSESKNTGSHTATFPMSLPLYFIPIATDNGDVVMDPFMGSGKTILASLKLNRKYIGFEIFDKNFREAEANINNYKEKLKYGFEPREHTTPLF